MAVKIFHGDGTVSDPIVPGDGTLNITGDLSVDGDIIIAGGVNGLTVNGNTGSILYNVEIGDVNYNAGASIIGLGNVPLWVRTNTSNIDSATAVGIVLGPQASFTTPGSKLLQVLNATSERLNVDRFGSIEIGESTDVGPHKEIRVRGNNLLLLKTPDRSPAALVSIGETIAMNGGNPGSVFTVGYHGDLSSATQQWDGGGTKQAFKILAINGGVFNAPIDWKGYELSVTDVGLNTTGPDAKFLTFSLNATELMNVKADGTVRTKGIKALVNSLSLEAAADNQPLYIVDDGNGQLILAVSPDGVTGQAITISYFDEAIRLYGGSSQAAGIQVNSADELILHSDAGQVFLASPNGLSVNINTTDGDAEIQMGGDGSNSHIDIQINSSAGYIILSETGIDYQSSVGDAAAAVAHTLNTNEAITSAGAKLLSIQNNAVEQLSFSANDTVLGSPGWVGADTVPLAMRSGAGQWFYVSNEDFTSYIQVPPPSAGGPVAITGGNTANIAVNISDGTGSNAVHVRGDGGGVHIYGGTGTTLTTHDGTVTFLGAVGDAAWNNSLSTFYVPTLITPIVNGVINQELLIQSKGTGNLNIYTNGVDTSTGAGIEFNDNNNSLNLFGGVSGAYVNLYLNSPAGNARLVLQGSGKILTLNPGTDGSVLIGGSSDPAQVKATLNPVGPGNGRATLSFDTADANYVDIESQPGGSGWTFISDFGYSFDTPSGTVLTIRDEEIEFNQGQRSRLQVITAAGTYQILTTDFYVVIDKTVPTANQVNLPAVANAGHTVKVKDGKGDAATNNITIDGNGANIDGASTFVINTNYASLELVFNSTQWNIF